MDLMEIFNQLMDLIKNFNGMDVAGKIAGIVLLIIAIVKSSLLRPLWDKAGAWKIVVAPSLSLVVAFVMIQPFEPKAIFTSLLSGALAVATHELLDAIKNIPGVGPAYVKAITFIQMLLKAPKAQVAQVEEKK